MFVLILSHLLGTDHTQLLVIHQSDAQAESKKGTFGPRIAGVWRRRRPVPRIEDTSLIGKSMDMSEMVAMATDGP